MKNSIITELQIVKAIKEYEGGRELNDVYRELGIHKSTFYNWRKKYAGMDSQELKRLKDMEEENRKLKLMYFGAGFGSQPFKRRSDKKVLKPCQRKDMVAYLMEFRQVTISGAYRVVTPPKSMYYYKNVRDDSVTIGKLLELSERHRTEGQDLYHSCIRQQGLRWNCKRVTCLSIVGHEYPAERFADAYLPG